jgi:hypothetical protein
MERTYHRSCDDGNGDEHSTNHIVSVPSGLVSFRLVLLRLLCAGGRFDHINRGLLRREDGFDELFSLDI